MDIFAWFKKKKCFLVRELQQDIRDLSQADLSEVDPEENSAEFMGILITVHESY